MIQRYLDVQRIHSLTDYLERLHAQVTQRRPPAPAAAPARTRCLRKGAPRLGRSCGRARVCQAALRTRLLPAKPGHSGGHAARRSRGRRDSVAPPMSAACSSGPRLVRPHHAAAQLLHQAQGRRQTGCLHPGAHCRSRRRQSLLRYLSGASHSCRSRAAHARLSSLRLQPASEVPSAVCGEAGGALATRLRDCQSLLMGGDLPAVLPPLPAPPCRPAAGRWSDVAGRPAL